MTVMPHSVDIVGTDMSASLAFYRDLGLPLPGGREYNGQAEIVIPCGAAIGLPWDSQWGQRYAFIADPDGNRIDLFADREK